MRKPVEGVAIVTAACLWLSLVPPPARSHFGLGLSEDPCIRSAGPYLIHFAVYQPEIDPVGEYCEEIPRVGDAIFVFDLVDRELRKERAEITVERRHPGEDRSETLLSIPARRYPSGMVNTEFRFEGPGEYTAVVTLVDLSRMTRFPLRVEMWSRSWLPFAGGALLLGIPFGYLTLIRFRSAAQERS